MKISKEFFRKYALYLVRWQASSLILAPCISLMADAPAIVSACVANLIGGLIFFWVDALLIFRNKNDAND